jgi:hypothetical protein
MFLCLASGCLNDDGSSTGPGTLVVKLTDAPFPFDFVESANVTIDEVSVRIAATEESASGFQVLTTERQPVNLLELQNGVTTTLVEREMPAGEIDQIRIVISEASVTLKDGRVFDLKVPSGASSGLKVFPTPPVVVATSLTTELLLDCDVSESFKAIPRSPKKMSAIRSFQFHPVLRVVNRSETGTISGRVLTNGGTTLDESDDAPLQGVAVTVHGAAEALTTTSTNETGEYRIMGLLPGEYEITAEKVGFEAASLTATVVVANDNGGNDFHLEPTFTEREYDPAIAK